MFLCHVPCIFAPPRRRCMHMRVFSNITAHLQVDLRIRAIKLCVVLYQDGAKTGAKFDWTRSWYLVSKFLLVCLLFIQTVFFVFQLFGVPHNKRVAELHRVTTEVPFVAYLDLLDVAACSCALFLLLKPRGLQAGYSLGRGRDFPIGWESCECIYVQSLIFTFLNPFKTFKIVLLKVCKYCRAHELLTANVICMLFKTIASSFFYEFELTLFFFSL
ncbi:hypothetical protein O6H91_04G112700 [Diphasiastrum complanatum]|uniref:Uncharacterized protein n=1 Tax=Diphasiastrum complanatum TaxID=34168 RepID=A0ACC2E0P2_DIPCM|nr:hypothetical protein O6H91_04G112700 [Diphasiastrum complanatum]